LLTRPVPIRISDDAGLSRESLNCKKAWQHQIPGLKTPTAISLSQCRNFLELKIAVGCALLIRPGEAGPFSFGSVRKWRVFLVSQILATFYPTARQDAECVSGEKSRCSRPLLAGCRHSDHNPRHSEIEMVRSPLRGGVVQKGCRLVNPTITQNRILPLSRFCPPHHISHLFISGRPLCRIPHLHSHSYSVPSPLTNMRAQHPIRRDFFSGTLAFFFFLFFFFSFFSFLFFF